MTCGRDDTSQVNNNNPSMTYAACPRELTQVTDHDVKDADITFRLILNYIEEEVCIVDRLIYLLIITTNIHIHILLPYPTPY